VRTALLALAILIPVAAGADEAPTSIPFRADRWQIRAGKWRFEPDGTLLCEGKQLSSLIYLRGDNSKVRDLDLSVEVMFLGAESSAGLVVRARGENYYSNMGFYQFEWYTEGHHHGRRLSLMTKNPRWNQIVTPVLRDAPYNKWIKLRVRAEGDHLQAFVDGERVFEKHNRVFDDAGRLGLHVFQARQVRFRDLRLERLAPAKPPSK
jgi:hypothetical protein